MTIHAMENWHQRKRIGRTRQQQITHKKNLKPEAKEREQRREHIGNRTDPYQSGIADPMGHFGRNYQADGNGDDENYHDEGICACFDF